jgi:hypothetical protein
MTSTIPTDAATHVVCAYRWLDRGKVDQCEQQLRNLTPAQLRSASRDLQRLAVIVEALLYEAELAAIAVAVLTPDCPSLPCVWCGVVDCDNRDVHGQLDRISEVGNWKRARGVAT